MQRIMDGGLHEMIDQLIAHDQARRLEEASA
jgi:protein subunit release factor A